MSKMRSNGLMIVISGPAGSGKGTVTKHLLDTGEFVRSVSATTRAPRSEDKNGVTYHFITRDEFLNRIDSGDMLEHTEYCGNFYGTPKKEAEMILASGKNLILEIEVEGAKNIKKKFPEAVLIMLLPPSYSVQEQRLRNRGTETEDKILERLMRTRDEVKEAPYYDYVVYNYDKADKEAADQIYSIVAAEKHAMKRNADTVNKYFDN